MADDILDAPDGILIIRKFLSQDDMEKFKYFADGQIGIVNKEEITDTDGKLTKRINDGLRSERIYVREIHDLATYVCNRIFGKIIPDAYGVKIEWYEYPHIIRYRKDGKYIPHADADAYFDDKTGWFRNVERDYSAVMYFNDEFEGGGLYFPNQDFRIKPEPGLLVCFPSDSGFIHTAEPVISGIRYAFVTWAVAFGSERLFDKPKGEVIYMHSEHE